MHVYAENVKRLKKLWEVSFCKRAADYRALLQTMTSKRLKNVGDLYEN